MDWGLMLLGMGPVHLLNSTIGTRELVDYVRRHSLTYLSSVGTTFALLTSFASWIPKGALGSLRTICCGGSAFYRATAHKLAALVPGATMFNLFGPTEATVYCAGTRVDLGVASENATIDIGVPLSGQRFLFGIGDEISETPPRGECELLLSGTQLMEGYLGAESGLVDVFRGGRTQRVYRTGDLVLFDGERLYFSGRKGGFVKSRGYRISPQEVENAFLASPKIRECAAVAIPDPVAENLLVLCYVADDGRDVEDVELEAHGAARLAPYSIPRRFVRCERIPKSSSGKIDQAALVRTLRASEPAV
jgi:acyl-CoA synthetase (AMP-forming)/AMP-acid ligase II